MSVFHFRMPTYGYLYLYSRCFWHNFTYFYEMYGVDKQVWEVQQLNCPTDMFQLVSLVKAAGGLTSQKPKAIIVFKLQNMSLIQKLQGYRLSGFVCWFFFFKFMFFLMLCVLIRKHSTWQNLLRYDNSSNLHGHMLFILAKTNRFFVEKLEKSNR